MYQFDDKVVVVTGAAGALGSAVAQYFKQQGASVAHLDYSDELLNHIFPDREEKHVYLAVDLTQRESCSNTFNLIKKRFGRIDILANIAGGFLMGDPIHETTDSTWDFLFNLNARSILNTSAAVVPLMLAQGGGKIINISAGAANKGVANMGAYIASKSAVSRITESMAMELKKENINVNCVLPSIINTQRNREDMPNADYSTWIKPDSIARVIGFLVSEDAKDIHGVGIPVAGLN